MMKLIKTRLALAGCLTTGLVVQAQDDEVIELSPFAVDAAEDVGYRATTTLAGSRVRSNIGDLGASISVITEEFMEDTGATDGESLLQFVGNVEVGGVLGNYSNASGNNTVESRVNPQRGQRVRGLSSAQLTRDYFTTDIPFDSYNTTRVTVNRGPNSILFGLGSPGGVINNSTKRAYIGNDNTDFTFRVDHRGGTRATFDIGRTVIDDRLAIRVAGLREDLKWKQRPTFEEDTRLFLAYDLTIAKNENSNWLGRTSLRGNFEQGKIDRNPPDVVPPSDGFSSWWDGIGDQEDLNRILQVPGVDFTQIPNAAVTSQQVIAAINGGFAQLPEGADLNEYAAAEGQFVPRTTVDRFKRGNPLGNDPTEGGRNSSVQTTPYFLFPAINYNRHNSDVKGWDSPELEGIQGIMGRWRPNGFATQDVRWSSPATAGAANGFEGKSLQNRNVFDYHNNMFAGTTNLITTEFDMNQVFLEQELFGGRAGIELAFDKQSRDQYEFTPFDNGDTKTIRIDLGQHHSPGDSDFDGVPDRLANENVGRAVIRWNDNFERFRYNIQDTYRATVFGTLDASDVFQNDGLAKILGKHTLTGLWEERTNLNSQRQIRGSWWADNATTDNGLWPGSSNISNGLSDNFRRIVKSQVYITDDLRGLTSSDQVRVNGFVDVDFPKIGDEYGIWYFDNGPDDVDKINTWRIIENEGPSSLNKNVLTSEAWSLQSTFFAGNVVALYGERTDDQDAFDRYRSTGYGAAGIDGAERLDLPGLNEVDGTFNADLHQIDPDSLVFNTGSTSTKSLVVKFPEEYLFELPFGMDLQAHYYEADSFQPAGLSKNVIGEPLASPLGVTEEKGAQITLLEGKLSIRYNEFETALANNRTNLGGQLAQIANRFDFFLDRITSAENAADVNLYPNGYDPDPNVSGVYDGSLASYTASGDAAYTPDTADVGPDFKTNRQRLSGTDADIAGFESWDEYYQAIIDAIHPSIQSLRNFRVDTLESGERVDLNDPIIGLNSTQDFVATGKEIDIVGQVTKNLTLFANIAQQKTITDNTGPVAIPLARAQAELLQRPLSTSSGGWSLWDLRDSPFQVETGTIGTRYNVVLRQMNIEEGKDGTQLAEQREWRVNVSGRWDFLDGPLKGVQVGGSLRYQDKVAGGYPNRIDEFGNVLPDTTNPWFGPDSIDGDVFIRYGRPIMNGKADWTIQLNGRNAYRSNGDEDIPINFDADGSVRLIRVPVEQQWFLTNTFRF